MWLDSTLKTYSAHGAEAEVTDQMHPSSSLLSCHSIFLQLYLKPTVHVLVAVFRCGEIGHQCYGLLYINY